jgi:glucosamine 6-phosphate synthetase-like amidotransferase/phosphosugar isomerase protein
MCSIIGSYNKDKFIELLNLNRYRGSFSHSLTLYNEHEVRTFKDFGDFNLELLDHINDGDYLLGHCQAPTGGLVKEYSRIHPYVSEDFKLLHNGIIKTEALAQINKLLNSEYLWDTQALGELIKDDFSKLSDIEGSFACVCIKDNEIYMFRNAISPLYINGANISSTKFADSKMIDHNNVFKLSNNEFILHDIFHNQHNPYYF